LLAADDQGADTGDRHVEERLHRVADLDLVGVADDLEDDLLGVLVTLGHRLGGAAGLAETRALLGEERALDDRLWCSHDVPHSACCAADGRSDSSICLTEAEVNTTASWRRMS